MQLFLLGGFLGSGKTTAIQQACLELLKDNMGIGVITNDQGIQLVDSGFIKGFMIPNREVVKGCFCCNYSQLEKAILSLQEEGSPEILFAESVGSCADIVATVIKPLLKFHPDLEIVYSVFADALNLLKMTKGDPVFFDDDVNYIFEKQLEEADILVVNKTDLLSSEEHKEVTFWLKQHFPDKALLFQNSLKKEDIKKWLAALQQFKPEGERRPLQIDYDKYGSGEAKLTWLDEELQITTENHDALEIANKLVNLLYEKVRQKKYPIGHLKFLITSGQWQKKISFTSLYEPALKQTHTFLPFNTVTLLINARVQTQPQILKQLLTDSIHEVTNNNISKIESKGSSAFQPGYPKPENRIEY